MRSYPISRRDSDRGNRWPRRRSRRDQWRSVCSAGRERGGREGGRRGKYLPPGPRAMLTLPVFCWTETSCRDRCDRCGQDSKQAERRERVHIESGRYFSLSAQGSAWTLLHHASVGGSRRGRERATHESTWRKQREGEKRNALSSCSAPTPRFSGGNELRHPPRLAAEPPDTRHVPLHPVTAQIPSLPSHKIITHSSPQQGTRRQGSVWRSLQGYPHTHRARRCAQSHRSRHPRRRYFRNTERGRAPLRNARRSQVPHHPLPRMLSQRDGALDCDGFRFRGIHSNSRKSHFPSHSAPYSPRIRTQMKSGKIEEKYIVLIVREVLVALSFLHRQGIIHRDVKGSSSHCAHRFLC